MSEKKCKKSKDGEHCYHINYGEQIYETGDPREPTGHRDHYICCWCGDQQTGKDVLFPSHGKFQPSWQTSSSGTVSPACAGHETIA
jgi:hypothetical protein